MESGVYVRWLKGSKKGGTNNQEKAHGMACSKLGGNRSWTKLKAQSSKPQKSSKLQTPGTFPSARGDHWNLELSFEL
jgi:hypothetical protein